MSERQPLTPQAPSPAKGEGEQRIARGILAVREGHGANCSSIGSVIDTLFAAAVVGGAVMAAVAAALAKEDVRVVGSREKAQEKDVKSEEPRP